MKIVFDMDNVLTDEMGKNVRPGILPIVAALYAKKHTVVVWTSSTRSRAARILDNHGIRQHISKLIAREQYDPEGLDVIKETWTIDTDFYVEDDPRQVRANQAQGVTSIKMTPFRDGKALPKNDLDALKAAIGRFL